MNRFASPILFGTRGFTLRKRGRWLLRTVGLGMLLAPAWAAQAPAVLTNLSQVRALSPEEARQARPVHVRGVVTYMDPTGTLLFMQDATDAIFVGYSNKTVSVRPGDAVEVHGLTDPGTFNPCISFGHLTVVGKAAFPAARVAPLPALMQGQEDSRWVEVQGVLRAVRPRNDRTELEIVSQGARLLMTVAEPVPPDGDPAQGVGARLRVHGVCGVLLRPERRAAGAQLFVPYWTNVVELEPRPKDIPLVTARALLQAPASPEAVPLVRVRGRFAGMNGGAVLLRDDSDAVRVLSTQESLARSNEWIEAIGFPQVSGSSLTLEDATFRLLAPSLAQIQAGATNAADPTVVNDWLPVPTRPEDVRVLSEPEARRGQPVRLRGVLTYADPHWRMAFVQRAQAAVAVEVVAPELASLSVGQAVEVEGFTDARRFTPHVAQARLFPLDRPAAWPEPRRVTMEDLRTGRDDGQWVEVNGVVRAVTNLDEHLSLDVHVGGGRFHAWVPGIADAGPFAPLLDARVRLRGVCSVVANARRQMIGVELYLPGTNHLVIQDPGAREPFRLATIPVRKLFQFDPGRDPRRLVKVQGVVTATWQRRLVFLREGTDALLVRPAALAEDLLPGQLIEAVGWPEGNARSPVLEGAKCRRLPGADTPEPRQLTIERLSRESHHAELVQVQGRLVNVVRGHGWVELQMQEGAERFVALLDLADANWRRVLREKGARLRLTGACLTQPDQSGQPGLLQLYLRSLDDVKVLARPPWWQRELVRQSLRIGGGLLVGVSLAGLFWRQRMARQNELIRQQQRELAFSGLGQELSTAATPQEAGRVIVEVAARILGWDACRLSLFSEQGDRELVVVKKDTIEGRVTDVAPMGEDPVSPMSLKVAREGPQLILRDDSTPADETLVPFGDTHRRSASLMFVPIHRGGRVVGVLSIQSYRPRAYTRDDLRRLQALADHCAGALERIRAQEVLRRTNEQLEQRVRERTAELVAANESLRREMAERQEAEQALQAAHAALEQRVAERTAELSRANARLQQEIEERRQIEIALRQAESEMEKLANFARCNPNPVLEFAADGRLTYFNEATLRMARTLKKQHPSEILPAETPEIVRHCLASGESRLRVETRHNGRIVSWSFFPIPQSRVVHCYAGDITERLQLEEQLRQALKMESIGRLAGGVAHDFNNILTIIQGHATLLAGDPGSARRVAESSREILQAAERAALLTRQLLAFSRKQPLLLTPVDLNEVVGQLTTMLRRLIGEDISLQVHPCREPLVVVADTGMIQQILLNLAVNARDAMPRGGDLLIRLDAVTLSAATLAAHPHGRPGQFACLTVRDTGCGMDEALLAHLFEPFFTTKDVGKGTGLGLAAVYGIVQQHAGWIEVTSKPQQGTTFRVYLPRAEKPTEPARPAEPPPEPRRGHETVLVVEDEPGVRDLVSSVLRKSGYEVLAAGSGPEALQLWEQHRDRIRLLLTDVVMPQGMSGLALAQRLQAERPALKVIFSSGYSMDMVDESLRLKPGLILLSKPYQVATLLQTVRACLNGQAPDSPV